MSNAIFPSLPGLDWSVVKSPTFNTLVVASANLKETRVALAQDPVYRFTMSFSYLRDDPSDSAHLINGYTELAALMGFIEARQGSFDSFLYLDPNDFAATAQATIPPTGDGTNKLFQLARQRGGNGYSETVQNVKGTPTVYVGGTAQASGYSIGDTGLITFNTAPASGAAIAWTGEFYFRCRFGSDAQDFTNWIQDVWESQTLTFQSVKL